MSNAKLKSRTFRRIKVKTPGGKTNTHFRRRKPSKAICATCRKTLLGVPQGLPMQVAKLPKTARRPERPYGGVLCSACTRKVLQQRARAAP
ncbi:TPA: 50S ribosomal protein L34e [Candidatus Woesearchaeota archaeon]|nr:50S ribosomal protein L34e [Candidatus Woesearchaeota archaeon]HIH12232.1 50S ribosomal protein L34e [Candidatus Woesearchaeota archaeon]